MPGIHKIANSIDRAGDIARTEFIDHLSKKENRNVICYYANFSGKGDTSINDSDLRGFMSTVFQLDKKIGLDLILHTPGGDPAATE
ncbi:MAG: hypothetical protein LBC78_04390, partial [Oscillospiraceae bacterium]|nr:hypothetical protein [Oscillospiraceae bacterium]